jgi:glycosyltransferase involved in cell wall biosynthesis
LSFRICFVAPTAYPVLAGSRDIKFVGGAEVQQVFLAQELARRGHIVSMISMDHGQREGDSIKGVRLFKMYAPDAGLPVLRFIHPRWTSIWRAMKRANAEIYYQRAAGAATGFVVSFAAVHRRYSVYAAAHDLEFDPTVPQVRYSRDKYLFRYGARNADRLVVQSDRQVMACRETFGRESTCIKSCYGYEGESGMQQGRILWVGNVKPIKRPELFLDLAEKLPQFRFRLVGGPAAGAAHFEVLRRRAETLGNVEMVGFIPYSDVEQHFDGASILINTSDGEGFPNTFMQAWSRGIPTVSFFDSGAKYQGAEVGEVVPDVESMARVVKTIKVDAGVWLEKSATSAAYFRQHHTVTKVVDDYERLFDSLSTVPR